MKGDYLNLSDELNVKNMKNDDGLEKLCAASV